MTTRRNDNVSDIPLTRVLMKRQGSYATGGRRRWLRENDRLLGMADRFERLFQRVGHRRGATEKNHGVRTGRRQMLAQNALGDAARALRPASRRLLQP